MTPNPRTRSLSNRELRHESPTSDTDALMRLMSDVIDRAGAAPTPKDAAQDALQPMLTVLRMDYGSYLSVEDGSATLLASSGQVASVFRASVEDATFGPRDGAVGRAMLSTEVCSATGDDVFDGLCGAGARRARLLIGEGASSKAACSLHTEAAKLDAEQAR